MSALSVVSLTSGVVAKPNNGLFVNGKGFCFVFENTLNDFAAMPQN